MTKSEIQDKIKHMTQIQQKATFENKDADILVPQNFGGIFLEEKEKSLKITQSVIKNCVDIGTSEKAYDIFLTSGPYHSKYDATGRYTLLNNKNGFLSMFDTKTKHLFFEIDIEDKFLDTTFLHNELFMGVAQRKNLYIYDSVGREVHCVRKCKNVNKMEFLPHHFLLVCLSKTDDLTYLDTSVGKIISEIKTNEMNTTIKTNPNNAIIHLGNDAGSVTLWTPNSKNYVMKIRCHESRINNIEIDRNGTLMVTNGCDNLIKVWDVRNTYSPMNIIDTKINYTGLALSQTNMLALGLKNRLVVLNEICSSGRQNIYLKEKLEGKAINSLDFCPFEDILAVGHSKGFSSLIIPGSGDSVYDSYELSPFRTKKQRQENEVKQLLEKIPASMISLTSKIGVINIAKEPKQEVNIDKKPHIEGALKRFY